MPNIEAFRPRELGPKSWGREVLVAHTAAYLGKVLYMRAGESGPLQYHERKDETFHLFTGLAAVTTRSGPGGFITTTMQAGESYHVPPFTVHQVAALEDCVFFETSTPVFEDRVAVAR